MWFTPGRASGYTTLLQYSSTNTPEEGECYEEEVQPHRKTDYKPMIYIILYCFCVCKFERLMLLILIEALYTLY